MKTKKIRGLLCNFCNVSIGQMLEDVEIFKSAVIYLETHKNT